MQPARRRLLVALAVTGIVGIGVFTVLAPREDCPPVDATRLRASAAAAVRWMDLNQRPDGSWLYEYDRATDTATPDYNDVRHAGLVEALYQADTAGIPGARAIADRGLAWTEARSVDHDGWTAVRGGDVLSTGTNALLLAGLVERRLTTGDTTYDARMARLADFLVTMTEPSGAVLASWDPATNRPLPGYSKYFTGEAYWALARMHRLFPDAGYGAVADRIGGYLASSRDHAEDLWPPIPDHWAGYGLGETSVFPERAARQPLTDAEVAYARRQAGLFGVQVRFLAQRNGDLGTIVRGPGELRGGGYGVVGEGLTGLWHASREDTRLADLQVPLAARAECLAGLAVAAQTTEAQSSAYAAPQKVAGAWFAGDVTRMDDQQHALSALVRTLAVLDAAPPAVPPSPRGPQPTPWLWALLALAVLNPVRAALGVPSEGRRRGEVVSLATVGSLLGAALLLAVGAASGWLLDTLGVSASSMRLAVGLLALVSAVIDLVRPRPSPEPALRGQGAALVPVAIPLVVRPAMVFVALGLVADQGMAVLAGVLAVVVVLVPVMTAALTPAGPEADPRLPTIETLAVWTVRALAAAAVVAAVLLILSGIFSI